MAAIATDHRSFLPSALSPGMQSWPSFQAGEVTERSRHFGSGASDEVEVEGVQLFPGDRYTGRLPELIGVLHESRVARHRYECRAQDRQTFHGNIGRCDEWHARH